MRRQELRLRKSSEVLKIDFMTLWNGSINCSKFASAYLMLSIVIRTDLTMMLADLSGISIAYASTSFNLACASVFVCRETSRPG